MRRGHCLLSIACALTLALSGCGGSESPRPARIIEPAPSQHDFGALRVYYNVLPTLAMNEAVARRYGVARRADQALLVVALRQSRDGDEVASDGHVAATATDLSGRRQQIVLRPVSTGDYLDHVGVVQISRHDTLRLAVQVQAASGGGEIRFERNF